ncbi:MAG: hypothetical protein HC923_03500 [Myxococcales bacterium]|nr:hypothetical protein [Myxococcales bacterium]
MMRHSAVGLFTLASLALPAVAFAAPAKLISRHDLGHCERPLFSPDGKEVAYERRLSEGIELYIVNADGTGDARRILPNGFDPGAAAGGSGKASGGSAFDAFDVGSGQPPGKVCRDFAWSMDPRRFAYACNSAEGMQVFLQQGGQGVPVDPTRALTGLPAWCPKRHALAYVASVNGRGEIFKVEYNISTPTPPAPATSGSGGGASVSGLGGERAIAGLRTVPTRRGVGRASRGGAIVDRTCGPFEQAHELEGLRALPDPSPTGKRMAFFAHESSKAKEQDAGASVSFELRVQDLETKVIQNLADDATAHRSGQPGPPTESFSSTLETMRRQGTPSSRSRPTPTRCALSYPRAPWVTPIHKWSRPGMADGSWPSRRPAQRRGPIALTLRYTCGISSR